MIKTSAAPSRMRSCPIHLRFVPRYLMTAEGREKALSKAPYAQIPEMHVPLPSTREESTKTPQ